MKNKTMKRLVQGLTVLILAFAIFLAGRYSARYHLLAPSPTSDSNVQSLTGQDFQMLSDLNATIQHFYIEDVNKTDLLEGAMKGMVQALGDPHSEFLNKQESVSFDDDIDGSFEGVGIQIASRDGQIVVISPIEDTPASQAGIQPNDILLEADGQELTGMDTGEVVSLIRGPKGSSVKLKLQRGSDSFEVELERAEIPIHSVKGQLDEDEPDLGYVQINQFSGTTSDELQAAVEDLRGKGAKKFIFDVRFNPGGLMDQALKVANMFVEEGQVLMQTDDGHQDPTVYKADQKEYGDFKITEPYVLLVNEGSASASEILAAAIKENTDHDLVGTQTFGKGSVQTILTQNDLGELKLTIARWLTPTGQWIHEEGVEPTQVVEADPVSQALLVSDPSKLEAGKSSPETKSIAMILDRLGYQTNQSDYFDDQLEAAIKDFQQANDLEVNGQVDEAFLTELYQEIRDYLQANDRQYQAAKEVLDKQ
ncbi:S41 family peptidase [Hutsoniella sourekii]